jgi:SAM-dependent methyltransferase
VNTFKYYSQVYDILYKNKNYQEESDYLLRHIQNYFTNAVNVLELGCGTGVHGSLLAESGYEVLGIDKSRQMIEIANKRRDTLAQTTKDRLSFQVGDIREFEPENKFDIILSLFHVMSYQTKNSDLLAVFKTVERSLNHGGMFLFDCWYGPAVLTDRPSKRMKKGENDTIRVTRTAIPTLLLRDNIVEVNFHIDLYDKVKLSSDSFNELHRMRYLFSPEIHYLFRKSGLSFELEEEWLTGNIPSDNTWYVIFIGRKS